MRNAKLCAKILNVLGRIWAKKGVFSSIMCRPRSDSASLTLAGLRSVGDYSRPSGGGDGGGSKQKFQLKKIISCCYDLQAQVQKFLLPLKGFAVVPPSYPPTTIIIHNNLVLWDSRQGYLLCSAFHGCCPKRALRRQV